MNYRLILCISLFIPALMQASQSQESKNFEQSEAKYHRALEEASANIIRAQELLAQFDQLDDETREDLRKNPDLYTDEEQQTINVKDAVYPLMPSYVGSSYSNTNRYKSPTLHLPQLEHYLNRNNSYVEATTSENHYTLLMHALQCREETQAKANDLIFSHNPDVHRKGRYGRTALYFAIRSDAPSSIKATQELLKRGARLTDIITEKGYAIKSMGWATPKIVTCVEHGSVAAYAQTCVDNPYINGIYWPTNEGGYYQDQSIYAQKLALIKEHLKKNNEATSYSSK